MKFARQRNEHVYTPRTATKSVGSPVEALQRFPGMSKSEQVELNAHK